jgi:hypothetical protein
VTRKTGRRSVRPASFEVTIVSFESSCQDGWKFRSNRRPEISRWFVQLRGVSCRLVGVRGPVAKAPNNGSQSACRVRPFALMANEMAIDRRSLAGAAGFGQGEDVSTTLTHPLGIIY